MITVSEAQSLCLALVQATGVETVPLTQAAGRVLAADVQSTRAQPPFAASAMDGYALQSQDCRPGAVLRVVGEAAAGHQWAGQIGAGEALRIFTGAPVPAGADRVVIQEDVRRAGDRITLGDKLDAGTNIRPQGADFAADYTLTAPRRLNASELALLAAMNAGHVPVRRKPEVAIIATGDELVMPGEDPRDDQIIASNLFALKAMIESVGGHVRLLPIARDTEASLMTVYEMAMGADLIVTIGGASVGDHDLVAQVAARFGLTQSFYKIAMRPGKPLIAGAFGDGTPYLGLPGNPVSAIVCGHLFLLPMLRAMQGLPDVLPPVLRAALASDVDGNGPRAHYMRARVSDGPAGREVTAFDRQDSSLLTVLSEANALLIRPPHDGPRSKGEMVDILHLTL
ncbi:MAG: molybdopterin molybdotransferase MoeA [Rhodobacterales bacterium]|nr:molybdopterin molybdotransferase MoeA [Rhodobacterales bacterium]MDX5411833.1 molybdopterin molybdotransferase MoeA [Rhodobacterales bacterium]